MVMLLPVVFAFVTVHPVATAQAPLEQTTVVPGTQTPPAQWSPEVQALLSVQALVLLVWTHPPGLLQVSVVQTLLSLQLIAA
jgi:hypothetical protein